ncbi:hypothetical protein POTOM_006554 [Populus tomentosa]|uniref:Uncharacterized protein n=1 Tax=Populus tomentosa TaxID=118781 RepID=A0A8X8D7J8_POPTO|nr:hypothetical protein POTOM_006554 [Populus tomentosa]
MIRSRLPSIWCAVVSLVYGILLLSLGAFLIFFETSIIPRAILGWFWFYSVSEVNGIGFCHHFLFLNTSVQFSGLMMESELRDLEACTFLVELQLDRPYPTRISDLSTWEEWVVLQWDGQPADTG